MILFVHNSANCWPILSSFIFGFSKKFAVKSLSYFPPQINLQNLKGDCYHFTITAVTKTYIEVHFYVLNVIHII